MLSSDFRKQARLKMEGKWGKAALISLAYVVILFIIDFILGMFSKNNRNIFDLIATIIKTPLSFGLMISLYKLYKSEETSSFDFISLGFNNFKRAWGVTLNIALKMIVPIILYIVAIIFFSISVTSALIMSPYNSSSSSAFSLILMIFGIILIISSAIWMAFKFYYYQLAYLVAIDNENISTKEAVNRSKEIMTGNRAKLFLLQLSFIGWAILATITFGIGFLWLAPYFQFATIAFYEFVSGKESSEVETEVITE